MITQLLLSFIIFLSPVDQPKLVKTKVADNITISIPTGWQSMDILDFTERFPSVRAPIAAYTNPERTIDLSVNISATQWPDANHELAQQFFKSSIMNMFDRVEIVKEGTYQLHGKKYVFFEFESRVNGSKGKVGLSDPVVRYTYLQYLIEPKRTLVFSFSCPRADRPAWEQTAALIMKSVRVR